MRTLAIALLLIASLVSPAAADDAADAPESPSLAWAALTYLPNRALDLLDVARVRVRVGPGMALGLRATEGADLFLGSYTTVFAGLPGPRAGAPVRLPAGVEARSGAEVSLADLSTGVGTAPSYGSAEIGASLQVFMIGFDLGLDPFQLIDALTGFLLIDPGGDDW